ncbi:MAG: hypothetical protein DCE92_10315 [Alphaproteobacteria bacterium]|nr:MAG: hypothetical protein DCE92_10315 [Alphaproteobacteria bacterium]
MVGPGSPPAGRLGLRRAKGYQTLRTFGFHAEFFPLDRSPPPLQAWYQEAPPLRREQSEPSIVRTGVAEVVGIERQDRSCSECATGAGVVELGGVADSCGLSRMGAVA